MHVGKIYGFLGNAKIKKIAVIWVLAFIQDVFFPKIFPPAFSKADVFLNFGLYLKSFAPHFLFFL